MKKLLVLFCLLLAIPIYGQVKRIARSTFAALGTPPNDSVRYCTDCTATSPCAGSGSGAFANRVNGAWNCTGGGGGGSGDMVLASTQTNTGAKTFNSATLLATRPRFTTSMDDTNGNEVIKTPATASAVNETTITNSATGQPVSISATGDDTNIGLTLLPKGTGITTIGTGATVVTITNAAAPASPSAGDTSLYSDSTDLRLHDKNASGVIGTTVVAATATANNFLTGITAVGAITKAQPAFTDISGTATGDQINHLVNAQTGTTYTVVAGDKGKLVTHTNGAAIAVTLPQATGSFAAGYYFDAENRGVGTATITPTTSTIDGAANLALTTNQGVRIFSDGTNYFTQRGIGGGGGSSVGAILTTGFQNSGPFDTSYFISANGGTSSGASGAQWSTTAEASVETVIPVACTARNFYIRTGSTQVTADGTLVFRVNGANSAATITITNGSAAGNYSNTGTTVSISAGDRVTWGITATLTGFKQLSFQCN